MASSKSKTKKQKVSRFDGLSRREAFAQVTTARKAVEYLLLFGRRKWRSHELQDAVRAQFKQLISESTVTRYCRFFCHPAIQPDTGRSYIYIHKSRSVK